MFKAIVAFALVLSPLAQSAFAEDTQLAQRAQLLDFVKSQNAEIDAATAVLNQLASDLGQAQYNNGIYTAVLDTSFYTGAGSITTGLIGSVMALSQESTPLQKVSGKWTFIVSATVFTISLASWTGSKIIAYMNEGEIAAINLKIDAAQKNLEVKRQALSKVMEKLGIDSSNIQYSGNTPSVLIGK